jgi:hypothetical protein
LAQALGTFIANKYPALHHEIGFAIDTTLTAAIKLRKQNGILDAKDITNTVMLCIEPQLPMEIYQIAQKPEFTETEKQEAAQAVNDAIRYTIKTDIDYLIADILEAELRIQNTKKKSIFGF